MPYSNDEAGDFDKLKIAFSEITHMFGSVDDLLAAFGLADMPQAQRYGILFGCIVFVCTISAVVGLLFVGGSFQRIQEQADTGEATLLSPADARAQRALLLERLLEGRERMVRKYPEDARSEEFTSLTTMLMNVAPNTHEIAELVHDDDKTGKKKQEIRRFMPPMYEENYVAAYRKCQDRPGGMLVAVFYVERHAFLPLSHSLFTHRARFHFFIFQRSTGTVLSGRPEARFETYARGFAACGPFTSITYRRSYGRLYEAICCGSHTADDKYIQLWKDRPSDIIGRYARLEPLEVKRHLQDLYKVTSGAPALENKAYDPDEVWGFLQDGPFDDAQAMRKSFVFQRKENEASFAIVHGVTERVIGAIILTNDDPTNLKMQMECPIIQPFREGCKEQLETCFLLIDRLFAYGYRRVQISIDSQDVLKRKLATRLGFTLEGCLYKHMVVKEASRDSNIYGMLNSDWKKGARGSIFRKLYGVAAHRADAINENKEEEFDEQDRFLKEKKREEQAAMASLKTKKAL